MPETKKEGQISRTTAFVDSPFDLFHIVLKKAVVDKA
jgi:hypothetical protein